MSAVFLDAFVDPKGRPLFFGRKVYRAGARAWAIAGAGEVQAGGKVEVESDVGADRAGAETFYIRKKITHFLVCCQRRNRR
jgi:hypothetical protein